MRKRSKYRPRGVNPQAHLVAIQGVAWLSIDDQTIWALQIADAITAVATAQAGEVHWRCIFDSVNLVEQLVRMRLARDTDGLVAAAQEACVAILDRQRDTGKRAVRAAELEALRALQAAWVTLMGNITQSERFQAAEAVQRRVNAALAGSMPGARVVTAPAGLLAEVAA